MIICFTSPLPQEGGKALPARLGCPFPARKGKPRAGLTLLEVVISVAIFLFSLVAITRLVIMGSDKAAEAKQLSQATMLCQAKLAEVVAGVESLTSSGSYTPFEEAPEWQWKLDCSESDVAGLWKVNVHVQRQSPDGNTFEVTLGQFVLPPTQRGSAADQQAASSATTGGSP